MPVVYANDHFGDWAADRSDIVRRARASGVFAGREQIVPLLDEPLILKPRYSAFDQTGHPGRQQAASSAPRPAPCRREMALDHDPAR